MKLRNEKPPTTDTPIDRLLKEEFGINFNQFQKYFEYDFDVERQFIKHGIFDLILIDIGVTNKKQLTESSLSKLIKESPKTFLNKIKYHSIMESPVIIIGESGTGKELIAAAIHKMSPRATKPFRAINCSGIPSELLESELYGYKKGAFTGANHDKSGFLEEANEGTMFLDELGKMPAVQQVKLLRTIQEKKFIRIGDTKDIPINIRFLAAAQPAEIDKILFDLLYRMGFPDCVQLPSLKERLKILNDIPIRLTFKKVLMEILKFEEFAAMHSDEKKNFIEIDDGAIKRLMSFDYTGNYRELENILRALIRNALVEENNLISSEDVDSLMESLKVRKDQKERDSKTDLQSDETENDIPLRNLIDKAKEIGKNKTSEVIIKRLLNFRNVRSEFDDESSYKVFCKEVSRRTGKGIREILKNNH